MGARSHFFSTPTAASDTPPARLMCADSYASDRGDSDMLTMLPLPLPSPALRRRSVSTQPWSPMHGASNAAGSLAAQGAGEDSPLPLPLCVKFISDIGSWLSG